MLRMSSRILGTATSIGILLVLSGCDTVRGFPDNPYDTQADIAAFKAASDARMIAEYYALPAEARGSKRDAIVYARIAAYDLEYQAFQSELFKETATGNVTGDLVILILNGVGATVGGVATKAAMNAASAGVVGAKDAVSKELYFSQTIPVLLTQMSTARTNQLTLIRRRLKKDDIIYPLSAAIADTDRYRDAGSIPSAVSLLAANVAAANTSAKKVQATSVANDLDAEQPVAAGVRSLRPPPAGITDGDAESFYRNLP